MRKRCASAPIRPVVRVAKGTHADGRPAARDTGRATCAKGEKLNRKERGLRDRPTPTETPASVRPSNTRQGSARLETGGPNDSAGTEKLAQSPRDESRAVRVIRKIVNNEAAIRTGARETNRVALTSATLRTTCQHGDRNLSGSARMPSGQQPQRMGGQA
ncbi:hypothetical protein HPB51_011203 [Rhipicephalus microplus]|uniref:Uncharacterized protein n=1 Tax=Rhipicephalus microplus TaxID=6941 RepID=A0A9J6F1J6_RHIMP|nr:hypothetical protein HPB51_011203 [Rhipicephalus microplus]